MHNNCRAFFQIDSWVREYFIESHSFLVQQSQSRLLEQFDDMNEEMEVFAERWLADHEQYFDPEHHDPGDFYDRARDETLTFFERLDDLKSNVRFSIAASMYHAWEKTLKERMVREMQYWHSGERAADQMWRADFSQMMDFFCALGWNVRGESFFASLDRCRLVVNVFKHGEGSSLKEMKQRYPDLLGHDPGSASGELIFAKEDLSFEDLRISDTHLKEFSEAIVSFWTRLPAELSIEDRSGLPDWLKKAISKDCKASSRRQGAAPGATQE